LAIEDLQWVDPSTLALLDALVDEVASSRVLGLFTARPDFAPSWSPTGFHAIKLYRLSVAEVGLMTGKLTGGRAFPEAMTEQIASRTDGVPLFVEELV